MKMTAERSPATLVSRRILDTLTDYDTKNVQTIVYEADCRRKALFHDYFGTPFLIQSGLVNLLPSDVSKVPTFCRPVKTMF